MANPIPNTLETVRQNSVPPLSSAPRTARAVEHRVPAPRIPTQNGGALTKNFVSPSNAHALIPEKKGYGPVQPVPPLIEKKVPASGGTPTAFVFSAPPAGRTPEESRPRRKSLKRDCWDTDDTATGTPEPGQAPGTPPAGVASAPRVMAVRPLQPSTSKAVQTVIVPTQGFVSPFSQFYERPRPRNPLKPPGRHPGSRNWQHYSGNPSPDQRRTAWRSPTNPGQ